MFETIVDQNAEDCKPAAESRLTLRLWDALRETYFSRRRRNPDYAFPCRYHGEAASFIPGKKRGYLWITLPGEARFANKAVLDYDFVAIPAALEADLRKKQSALESRP